MVTFQQTILSQRTLHELSTILFHNKQVTYVKDSISAQVYQPVANNLSTDVNYCVMYLRMAINCSPGNVNRLLEMRSLMRGHCWPVLGCVGIIVTGALIMAHRWSASNIH